MNKAHKGDIVSAIAQEHGFTDKEAASILDTALGAIKSMASTREMVIVKGFGTFYMAEMKAHTTKTPSTGEPCFVPSTTILRFRQSRSAR